MEMSECKTLDAFAKSQDWDSFKLMKEKSE